MKRVIYFLGFVLLAPLLSAAQNAEKQKRLLEKLAQDRSVALIQGDTLRMKEILDESFFYVNNEGKKRTRGEYIRNMTGQKDVKWLSQQIDSMDIRLPGKNTAILSFKVLDHFRFEGTEYRVWNRSTFVYIKKGGKWTCVSGHTSEIAGN